VTNNISASSINLPIIPRGSYINNFIQSGYLDFINNPGSDIDADDIDLIIKYCLLYYARLNRKMIFSGSNDINNIRNMIRKLMSHFIITFNILYDKEVFKSDNIDVALFFGYLQKPDKVNPIMDLNNNESAIIGENSILGSLPYYDYPEIIVHIILRYSDFEFIMRNKWLLYFSLVAIDYVFPIYLDYTVDFKINKNDCHFIIPGIDNGSIEELILGINSRLSLTGNLKSN